MVISREDILCEQAKFYYYDLLFQESNRIVPEFIINHIKKCQFCQKQILKLNSSLKQAESVNSSEQIKSSSEISSMLKLHFAYLNKPVNCEITKPFLPSLLDPDLAIRIPTPITVHLDHCKECAKDLKTIQNLGLNRAQLYRLSQLFSEKQSQDNVNCKQSQISIMAFVFLTFSEIDEKELKHLCICPECRKALYRFREAMKEELKSKKENNECSLFNQIPYNRKFDYVVPYGLDSVNIKALETQRSFTRHLRRCPTCLTKIQELHRKIYDISERSESGTVTIYKTVESDQSQPVNSKKLYAGYPINVEVEGGKSSTLVEKNDSIINFTTALKQKNLSINFKPAAKVGFAAAIILIAFLLSMNISPAKGIPLAQIVSNIKNYNNVHISNFSSGTTEPIQEQWISRSLSFKIYKTGDELALYDINNKKMLTKNLGSDLYESRPLTEEEVADFKFSIQKALGSVSKYFLPDDELKHITNQSIIENDNKYEITWEEKGYDNSVYHKLNVFIDPKTELLLKLETYRKLSANDKYELHTILDFEYLSDTEISDIKEKYF